MLSPIGTFSGLASGIQWRDLIDQIVTLESRPINRLQAQVDAGKRRTSAWSEFETKVRALKDAASAVAGDALRTNKVSLSGGTSIASASATSAAAVGSHAVRVLSLARAETLGGDVFATRSDALGMAGEFVINGRRIEVLSTDSLDAVARRINDANANGGMGVSASVLSTASGHRLVLSSTKTGEAGIDLVDGAAGVLRSIGLLDSTTSIKTLNTSGATSDAFANTTATIAALRGFTAPPAAGAVNIGGLSVALDPSAMSLEDVAAAINAAAGLAGRGITATVVQEGASFRLVIRGSTSFTDANRILETLGVLRGGRSAVAQQVQSAVLGDGGAAAATATTRLTNLWSGGADADVRAGDTLTLSGTRGDGSTFSVSYTVANNDRVQHLLDRLNSSVDGFGAGSRPATASIDASGRITVTDGTGGDSRLGLTIVAHNEGGGTLDFGAFTTTTVGRARTVAAGADAEVELNGSYVRSATNTVADAVPGLTLRLGAADPNTTVQVNVSRDVDAGVAAIQKVVDTYNALAEFVDTQLAPPPEGAAAQPLHGDAVLRTMRSTLRSALNTILDPGATGGYGRLAEIGIEISRTGRYTVNATKLRTAVENGAEAVARLMGVFGTTTGAGLTYAASTDASQAGTYAVNITRASTRAAVTGAGFAGTYSDDGQADMLTVRDTATNRSYAVALNDGMTMSDIVAALNAEFARPLRHIVAAGAALHRDAGGTAADDATLLTNLHQAGSSAGVAAGDTFTLSGTRRDGSAFLSSFVVASGSTLADLRTAAQQALGAGATVSWQGGVLTATADTEGSAGFTLNVSSNNLGGGTLDFAGFTATQQGRDATVIRASDEGGQLRLEHGSWGSAAGFEVSFTPGGADGSASLGIAAGAWTGVDVAGTIGGFAASGAGRTLTGSAGSAVEGLGVRYDGAVTGEAGWLTFSRGLASRVRLASDVILGSGGGSIRSVTDRIDGSMTRWKNRIDVLEGRLDRRREQLIKRFTALEAAMARAQSQSAWLDAQLRRFENPRTS